MTQHRYAVDGWGVGEIWVDDGVLLLHELAGTVPELSAMDASAQHEPPPPRALPPKGARAKGARAPLPER